ncbi:MAG TPA: flagellar brake protein [Oxalicibacterium sp.]
MTFVSNYEEDNLSQYRVTSRREVLTLMRALRDRNQLVRMILNRGHDTIVTSILDVDDTNDTMILDVAPTATMNHRVLDSDKLSFETVLDNIRILFSTTQAESCQYENLPAFIVPLPDNAVRLQRREFYRVPTPVTTPILCTVSFTENGQQTSVVTTLYNISGGGISMVDEKKMLDTTSGRIYDNCRIDLPGNPVTVALQVRNHMELALTNGKNVNRIGCAFVEPSNGTLAAVQKYITKLERDQNAKATGLG